MAQLNRGDSLPGFRYDSPYAAQQPVKALYAEKPAVFVFMNNLGHPVTRELVGGYCTDVDHLTDCALVCVVRSRPEAAARALAGQQLPFAMICDAEGALYEHFAVQQEDNPLRYCSLRAAGILRRARRQGYTLQKGQPVQLPLTLVVSPEGTVVFAHYGTSLTNLPESCDAANRLALQAMELWRSEAADGKDNREPETEQNDVVPGEAAEAEAAESAQQAEEPLPALTEESQEVPEQPAAGERKVEISEELQDKPESIPRRPRNEQVQTVEKPSDKYALEGYTLSSFFAGQDKDN